MPVNIERGESRWFIQAEECLTISCTAELKALLLEWLASATDLELDLERTAEIDIAALQLIFAASREAASEGRGIAGRFSAPVAAALRDSGFAQALGWAV